MNKSIFEGEGKNLQKLPYETYQF